MMKPYFEDNRTKIYQGNCLDVLRCLPDGCIDLTVTSPPYDNLRTYNGYTFDFEGIAKELYRVTKAGGVVVWVVGDATINGSETGTSFRQALFFKDVCGFNLHDTMIWNKEEFSATGSLFTRYAPVFEFMFILSKGLIKTFNPIKDRKNKWNGAPLHGTIRAANSTFRKVSGAKKKTVAEYGQRHNIWNIAGEKDNHLGHPAPFPESLANDHIKSWSNPGDTILDPFCGSGTTGKMAIKNGCKFIGIDISEEYCALSVKRLAQGVFNFAEAI